MAAVITFLITMALLGSLVLGIFQDNVQAWRGWKTVVPALFIALLNFFLSFIRPLIHRVVHGQMDTYQFASGVPLLGSLCVVISLVVGFGSLGTTSLALLAFLMDTGGPPWLLGVLNCERRRR